MPWSSSCRQMAFLIVYGSPRAVGELGVEVPDLAQAVTAQLQRVRQDADAVFADVEGVAPSLEWPRIAVRDDEFGHGCPVNDRAQPAVVLVADRVQHQSFARVEAQPETPLLPAHLPARRPSKLDARRLPYLDGFQPAARGRCCRPCSPRCRAAAARSRDPPPGQRPCRRDPRPRAARGSAWRTGYRPGWPGRSTASTSGACPRPPPGRRFRCPTTPPAPDPARSMPRRCKAVAEARVGPDQALAFRVLAERDRRPDAGDRPPRQDRPRREPTPTIAHRSCARPVPEPR